MAKNKKVKNIFLSAGVPTIDRPAKYYDTADVIAIRDSVIALASTVLAVKGYHLIWGGQPAITPLIALVLERYNLMMANKVTLYQSYEFEKFFPKENANVGHIIYTEKRENIEASLLLMRSKMIVIIQQQYLLEVWKVLKKNLRCLKNYIQMYLVCLSLLQELQLRYYIMSI